MSNKADKKALKKRMQKRWLSTLPVHLHKTRDHVWYGPKDFTKEEIMRKNVLAQAVLNEGLRICKYCGFQKIKGKPLAKHL